MSLDCNSLKITLFSFRINELMSVFYVSVLLLILKRVMKRFITLPKRCGSTRRSASWIHIFLTMLWRVSWSIRGQTHKKTDINSFFTITKLKRRSANFAHAIFAHAISYFMCLSSYRSWKSANQKARNWFVIVKKQTNCTSSITITGEIQDNLV